MSRTEFQFLALVVALVFALGFATNDDLIERVGKAGLPVYEPLSDAELMRIYVPACLENLQRWEGKEECAPTAKKLDWWQYVQEQEHYYERGLSERKQNVRVAGTLAAVIIGALLILRIVVSLLRAANENGHFDRPKRAMHSAGTRVAEREFYRIKRLYEDGLVSEAEFEEKRVALKARMDRDRGAP